MAQPRTIKSLRPDVARNVGNMDRHPDSFAQASSCSNLSLLRLEHPEIRGNTESATPVVHWNTFWMPRLRHSTVSTQLWYAPTWRALVLLVTNGEGAVQELLRTMSEPRNAVLKQFTAELAAYQGRLEVTELSLIHI